MVLFEELDKFNRKIVLTKERYAHTLEHPEMIKQEKRIQEVLKTPDIVKKSLHDEKVWLYYKFYKEFPRLADYLLVIVKLLNGKGFIITAFYTNYIKKGEIIWKMD